MDNLQLKFIEEATDLISDLENTLLQVEDKKEDQNLMIEKAFRTMHTLKGASSMFGFEKIGEVTHCLETIYEFVKSGEAAMSEELLSITFLSVDLIKLLLNHNDQLEDKESIDNHQKLLHKIKGIISKIENKEEGTEDQLSPGLVEVTEECIRTYYILLRPKEGMLTNGANPLYLIEELYSLGDCKATSHIKGIPELGEINESHCYIYWDFYLSTKATEKEIRDVFIFVEHLASLEIHKVADTNLFTHEKFLEKIETNSYGGEEVGVEELKEFINNLLQIIKTKSPEDDRINIKVKEKALSSVRVTTEKLDQLMNIVSEVVTLEARINLLAEKYSISDLTSVAEEARKLSRQLRDNALSMCLIPIETLFKRFQRLIRDLSLELNKDITLVTEGVETELDKTIIDALTDPLLHIIRNSVDHGIEDKATRLKKGKAENGTIVLKAFYSSNYVYIQIKDDGAGIDANKIRKKAIEKGLIQPDAELSEKEAFGLIFLPGFSTAEKVTEVSGRGVGMDVVRQKVSEIRGEIEVDSVVDQGTTITIKLPLTLSIVEGLLVKIDKTHYVIPLLSVEKCYMVKHEEVDNAFNNLITLDGEQVPFLYLRNEFQIESDSPSKEFIVTVKYNEQRMALVIDAIVGDIQAVIKPLGSFYQHLEVMLGATILGDGTAVLVIDPHRMIKKYSNKISA